MGDNNKRSPKRKRRLSPELDLGGLFHWSDFLQTEQLRHIHHVVAPDKRIYWVLTSGR